MEMYSKLVVIEKGANLSEKEKKRQCNTVLRWISLYLMYGERGYMFSGLLGSPFKALLKKKHYITTRFDVDKKKKITHLKNYKKKKKKQKQKKIYIICLGEEEKRGRGENFKFFFFE